MKHFVKTACLAILVAGLSGGAGAAALSSNTVSQAGDLLRTAYLSVVDAELARAEQKSVEAAAAYRKALELYGRIQAEYPGWQSAMVNYRVAECQNALAALDAAPGHEPPPVAATNAEARLQTLLSEIQDVRLVLAAQPEPLDVAARKQLVKERDQLHDQLEDQSRENRSLLGKISKLEARLKKAGVKESTNTLNSAVSTTIKNEARRLLGEDKTVEAILLLKDAAELMPSDTGILVMLGMAQCRIGKFADSLQTLQPLNVRHPSSVDAMLIIGAAYMGLGEIGEARVAMEKALKLNDNSAEAHYNMAQILISLLPPDAELAQVHYLRALELGMKPDLDFENTLRMNLVISKVKKHNAKNRNTTVEKSTVRGMITAPAPTP